VWPSAVAPGHAVDGTKPLPGPAEPGKEPGMPEKRKGVPQQSVGRAPVGCQNCVMCSDLQCLPGNLDPGSRGAIPAPPTCDTKEARTMRFSRKMIYAAATPAHSRGPARHHGGHAGERGRPAAAPGGVRLAGARQPAPVRDVPGPPGLRPEPRPGRLHELGLRRARLGRLRPAVRRAPADLRLPGRSVRPHPEGRTQASGHVT
jgi:hypothetical protein